MDTLEVKTTLTVTPTLLAQLFWQMRSTDQAEFFNALAGEIKQTYEDPNNKWAGSCGPEGEGQWWHLARDLLPQEMTDINEKGRAILMAMAAPLYLNVLRSAGQL